MKMNSMLTLYMIVEYELDPGGDVGEHVEGEENHQQEGCAPTYIIMWSFGSGLRLTGFIPLEKSHPT